MRYDLPDDAAERFPGPLAHDEAALHEERTDRFANLPRGLFRPDPDRALFATGSRQPDGVHRRPTWLSPR